MNTTVTTEFVKAVRKAARNKTFDTTSLVVETNIIEGDSARYSFVKLNVEKRNGKNATEPYTTYQTVTGATERIASYGDALRPTQRLVASANHYNSEKGVVSSLANLVKAGDELQLSWVLSNSTETLNKAGLQHDMVYVRIIRNGKFVAELLVDDTVCPFGSSALFAGGGYFANSNLRPHVDALVARIDEEVAA
jgi:hypothetical protein